MTIKADWAQVRKATQREVLRIDYPYCEKRKYDWLINGRSGGLTRTITIYCCDNCLLPALQDVRWS